MNREAVMATIDALVRDMIRETRTLEHLKRGYVERTIAADLANRLRPAFETERITVDPNYNKHRQAAKRRCPSSC